MAAASSEQTSIRPEARDVLILRNPRSGTGHGPERIAQLVSELKRRRFNPSVHSNLGEFEHAVAEGDLNHSIHAVIAAGGDGTAEIVVNRIPSNLPMAVFPLGTENLLAKYMGWTTNASALVEAIEQYHLTSMDAGMLSTSDGSSRLFLLMLGCGFDAEVIQRLHEHRTGPITHWSYAKPIVDSLRTYKYPRLHITCYDAAGTEPISTFPAHWAFVFNFPSYAVGLGICRDANPLDGVLDVTTFPGRSMWEGLVHLGAILLGRHRQQRGVQVMRVGRVSIESDQRVPVQVDGDPGGYLPVDVRVLPERWTAVVPTSRHANGDRPERLRERTI